MLKLLTLAKHYWKAFAGAAVAVGLSLFMLVNGRKKYSQGVKDEQAKQNQHAAKASARRVDIDENVLRMRDGGAADELRKRWSRD